MTDQQKSALRWDQQETYLSNSQLYPQVTPELDEKNGRPLDGNATAIEVSSSLQCIVDPTTSRPVCRLAIAHEYIGTRDTLEALAFRTASAIVDAGIFCGAIRFHDRDESLAPHWWQDRSYMESR